MIWFGLVCLLIVCFGGVLLVGAPYLPTLRPQIAAALKLADLQPGQTLLELGCGDGVVVLAAARQGFTVVGYELNPLLVLVARLRCWRYRKTVKIIWGDFWRAQWPSADAIFVFLLPKYMKKLDTKVMQYKQESVDAALHVVSFAFEIPGKAVDQKAGGVFLYKY